MSNTPELTWRSNKAREAINEAAELIANCYCSEDDTFIAEVERLCAGISEVVDRASSSAGERCVKCGHRATIDGICEVGMPERGKDRYGYNVKCGCKCEFSSAGEDTKPPSTVEEHKNEMLRRIDAHKGKSIAKDEARKDAQVAQRLAEIRARQDLRRLNHKVFNGSTEALDDIDYLLSLVDTARPQADDAQAEDEAERIITTWIEKSHTFSVIFPDDAVHLINNIRAHVALVHANGVRQGAEGAIPCAVCGNPISKFCPPCVKEGRHCD